MAQPILSNRYFKKAVGYSFILYFTLNIQYHLFFFVQYFILQFAFQELNVVLAFLISGLGLYLLCKIITLFFIASQKAGGPVKELKSAIVDVVKMRQAEVRKFSKWFTKED